MLGFIAIVHLIMALILIVLVLLQDSKGGAMGMLGGGGGGNSVLGTGAGNFLTTATKWVATIFAVTCVTLAYMTTHQSESVLDQYVPPVSEQKSIETTTTPPEATQKEAPPQPEKAK